MPEERAGRPLEVFILGSGRSINDLTPEEVAHINRAEVSIALNKFAIFHEVAGIVPTHVWFTEYHWPVERVLNHIFRVCARDRLEGLTFVLVDGQQITYHPNLLSHAKARLRRWRKGYDDWSIALAPRRWRRRLGWRFEFVRRSHPLTGTDWASSLDEPLYNHRVSFSSVLNYVTIRYPGATARLVGVDFNSPGYFFQEELDRMKPDWDDWSTQVQAAHGKHMAAIPHMGGTLFDKFPFIREQLDRAGVRVTCPNPNSAAITEGLAEYEPILPSTVNA